MKMKMKKKALYRMSAKELRHLVRKLTAEVKRRPTPEAAAAANLEVQRTADARVYSMQFSIRTAEMTLRGCMAENAILRKKVAKAGIPHA